MVITTLAFAISSGFAEKISRESTARSASLSRFQRSRPVVRESGIGRSLRVRIHGLVHGESLLGNVRVLGRDGSSLACPVKDSSGKIVPTLGRPPNRASNSLLDRDQRVRRPGTRPIAAECQLHSAFFHTLPSISCGPVARVIVRAILVAAERRLHAGDQRELGHPWNVLRRNKVRVLQAKASVSRPVDLLNFF